MADDYKDKYVQLLDQGKYEELYQHLQNWEEIDPHDPELYIAYFNYYYNLSISENITIKKQPPQEEAIVIKDPETGEKVGYLCSEIFYNEEEVELALEYLNDGLKRYPNRLDMHFGKIHALGEIFRYERQKNAIIDVLDISGKNNNKWLWHNGEKLDDACNYMIESIQGRVSHLFNNDIENRDEYVIEISEKVIELYPDVVYSYNNIAAVYLYQNNYQEAIKYFRLAEQKNPFDTIVINNIAYISMIMGDKDTSLEYYKKLKKYGDEEEIELAEQQIKKLTGGK
ncbi:MAG TPA: tetratricopeptide repeat protein [Halanaerobiales bacterium]|nr:tetratricopeptide repeat protein [Halanaerobiales bacterium]